VFAFFEAARETDVAFGVSGVATLGNAEVLGCTRSTIPARGSGMRAVGVEQLRVVMRIISVSTVALRGEEKAISRAALAEINKHAILHFYPKLTSCVGESFRTASRW
jgi:hypothetical protein